MLPLLGLVLLPLGVVLLGLVLLPEEEAPEFPVLLSEDIPVSLFLWCFLCFLVVVVVLCVVLVV